MPLNQSLPLSTAPFPHPYLIYTCICKCKAAGSPGDPRQGSKFKRLRTNRLWRSCQCASRQPSFPSEMTGSPGLDSPVTSWKLAGLAKEYSPPGFSTTSKNLQKSIILQTSLQRGCLWPPPALHAASALPFCLHPTHSHSSFQLKNQCQPCPNPPAPPGMESPSSELPLAWPLITVFFLLGQLLTLLTSL